jgi:hypothetical protein
MATQPLDASGESRAALRAVVKDHGAAALSDPQLMNNLLNDLMPGSPRESSVLVAAASANVAGILQERAAQHISTVAAVAQAAATLEERTALTPDACQWAARQMAEALDLPEGTEPLPVPVAVPVPVPVPVRGDRDPGTGPGAVPPRQPARKPASAAWRVTVGAAAAIVVVYLVVAVTAHLPPFGKSPSPRPISAPRTSSRQTPSPSPSPSQPPSPSPSPSHTGFQPTASDTTLLTLIPGKIQGDNDCAAVRPTSGAIAEVACHGAKGIPARFVNYYKFTKSAAMNRAYREFLSQFAHTSEASFACKNLTVFMPKCEGPFVSAKTGNTWGRIVEYSYKGTPDLSFTAKSRKLLIDMGGKHGNALVRWWIEPARYLVGGF